MMNVGSTPRKCFCGRAQPNFAHRGQQKPTHCAKCKEGGMVNIRASVCCCGKAVPSFGVPGVLQASLSSIAMHLCNIGVPAVLQAPL